MPATNGDDLLFDTTGNDVINALAGNDTVTVSLGNDVTDGGDDTDTLIFDYGASARNQSVSASSNGAGGWNGTMSDQIGDGNGWYATFYNFEKFDVRTGSGNDYIDLRNVGTDLKISTGTGDDYVLTGRGINTIDLGTGTNGWSSDHSDTATAILVDFQNSYYSGPGSTTGSFAYTGYFYTGSGNDNIVSGTGAYTESFDSGAGNDSITLVRGNDIAQGGEGTDTIVFDYGASNRSQSFSVGSNGAGGWNGTMSDGFADGNGWYASAYNFEKFDVRTGSGADSIDLRNVGTNLSISLGSNDDTAWIGTGSDVVLGGEGNDVVHIAGAMAGFSITQDGIGGYFIQDIDLADGNQGIDHLTGVETAAFNDGNVSLPAYTGLTLNGTTGNDTLNGNGNNDTISGLGGNDTINGNGGDDILNGGAGNNTMVGGSGNDTIIGGAGTDKLDGGIGADDLRGGAGNDTYTVNDAGDLVTEKLNEGTADLVNSSIAWTLSANVEKLTLTGALNIDGTGNELANTITGNTGNNLLKGLVGKDVINGGVGDDTIVGGSGADTLTGGAGADHFRFDVLEAATSKDTIKDFVHGTDKIEIDRAVFTAFAGDPLGALNPLELKLGTAAATASEHLIYNQATGALYYDANGVGGAAQVQIALFSTKPVLDANDFLLI